MEDKDIRFSFIPTPYNLNFLSKTNELLIDYNRYDVYGNHEGDYVRFTDYTKYIELVREMKGLQRSINSLKYMLARLVSLNNMASNLNQEEINDRLSVLDNILNQKEQVLNFYQVQVDVAKDSIDDLRELINEYNKENIELLNEMVALRKCFDVLVSNINNIIWCAYGKIWCNLPKWGLIAPLLRPKSVGGSAGTSGAGLSTGGVTNPTLSDIDIYNNETWRTMGNLLERRHSHTSIGEFFAIGTYGGMSHDGTSCMNTELYNGLSSSIRSTIPEKVTRASVIGNGNSYMVLGGLGENGTPISNAYIFNGETVGVANSPSKTIYDASATGSLLEGLITGGMYNFKSIENTEKFNGNVWYNGQNMLNKRFGHSCIGEQNSSMVFGGGFEQSSDILKFYGAITEKYDGIAFSFAASWNMIMGRIFHGGAGDDTDNAIAFGGDNVAGKTDHAEKYGVVPIDIDLPHLPTIPDDPDGPGPGDPDGPFTVTFKSWDHVTVLAVYREVELGDSVEPPEPPYKEDDEFDRWSSNEYLSVMRDLVIYTIYKSGAGTPPPSQGFGPFLVRFRLFPPITELIVHEMFSAVDKGSRMYSLNEGPTRDFILLTGPYEYEAKLEGYHTQIKGFNVIAPPNTPTNTTTPIKTININMVSLSSTLEILIIPQYLKDDVTLSLVDNNGFQQQYDDKYKFKLLDGVYFLNVSLTPYRSIINKEIVIEGRDKVVSIEMERPIVRFKVRPAADLITLFNSNREQVATGDFHNRLDLGRYTYTITKEGYMPINGEFELIDEDILLDYRLFEIRVPVQFNVEPNDTNHKINIKGAGSDGIGADRYLVKPGEYEYVVESDGYFDVVGTFEIREEDLDLKVDTDLDQNYLEIDVNLIKCNEIRFNLISPDSWNYIDIALHDSEGEKVEPKSEGLYEVVAGVYFYTTESKYYSDIQNEIVSVVDKDKEIDIELIPNIYTITFTHLPTNLNVSLKVSKDNKLKYPTISGGFIYELTHGWYDYEATAPSHMPLRGEFYVKKNDTIELEFISAIHKLEFLTTPLDSLVRVRRGGIDLVPDVLGGKVFTVGNGSYEYVVWKDGYTVVDGTVEVFNNDEEVIVALEKAHTLRFELIPSDVYGINNGPIVTLRPSFGGSNLRSIPGSGGRSFSTVEDVYIYTVRAYGYKSVTGTTKVITEDTVIDIVLEEAEFHILHFYHRPEDDPSSTIFTTRDVETGEVFSDPPRNREIPDIPAGKMLDRWDFDFSNAITSDHHIYPIFADAKYIVEFRDYSGILKDKELLVDHGYILTESELPEGKNAPHRIFSKWNYNFTEITRNTIIYAEYDFVEYEVTFIAKRKDNGEIIGEITRSKYTALTNVTNNYPREVRIPGGYAFVEWEEAENDKRIIEDMIIYGVYEEDAYTVKFFNWDGEELLVHENVEYGASVEQPDETPSFQDWIFVGWSEDFTYITEDLNVIAMYDLTFGTPINTATTPYKVNDLSFGAPFSYSIRTGTRQDGTPIFRRVNVGPTIMTGHDTGRLFTWGLDLSLANIEQPFLDEYEEDIDITACRFTKDGQRNALGTNKGFIAFQYRGGNRIKYDEVGSGTVRITVNDFDNYSFIANAGNGVTYGVFEPNINDPIKRSNMYHINPPTAIGRSADNVLQAFARGGTDNGIYLIEDGTFINIGTLDNNNHVFRMHNQEVTGIAFSPLDSAQMATSDLNKVYLWENMYGTINEEINTGGGCTTVIYSNCGTKIAMVKNSTNISVRDSYSGVEFFEFTEHNSQVTCMKWSSCGNFIVSGDIQGTLILWAAPTMVMVDFIDWDGLLLEKRFFPIGGNVEPIEDPEREGYEFIGWDEQEFFTNIQTHLRTNAIYEFIPL